MLDRPNFFGVEPMKNQGGFTLIEATVSAVILMVGVMALVQIGSSSTKQIAEIRQTFGQPAIAERLIHDQIEAIMAPETAPVTPHQVPPVGLGNSVYTVSAGSMNAECPTVPNLVCYAIKASFTSVTPWEDKPYKAGSLNAPAVYVWRLP